MRLARSRGAASLLAALAVGVVGSGCASCEGARPVHDAGRDGAADAESDGGGPDADGDADSDAAEDSDLPPGCEPLELVEMPHSREGKDCGRGCRQVTFADAVFRAHYNVGGQYLVYEGGDLESRALVVVDLQTLRETKVESGGVGEGIAPGAVES